MEAHVASIEPPDLATSLGLEDAQWTPLGGGRSNTIWKVRRAGRSTLVVKIYSETRGNPMFPNDPRAEALALGSLNGTGLAPEMLDLVEVAGSHVLIYQYVEGITGPESTHAAASTLKELHKIPPPPGLRLVPSGAEAAHAIAQYFVDQLGAEARALLPEAPKVPVGKASELVFLHGDPVPANMVSSDADLTLIDWQCPALGDPVEDLFVFLSPAMQTLYGAGPLKPDAVASFLTSYGDTGVIDRLIERAPLLHWRMVAYCLWMAQNGAKDYREAAQLELPFTKATARDHYHQILGS